MESSIYTNILNIFASLGPDSFTCAILVALIGSSFFGTVFEFLGNNGLKFFFSKDNKNLYLNSLKLYCPQMENVLSIEKSFRRSRFYAAYLLLIGFVIGTVIEFVIFGVFLLICKYILIIYHVERIDYNFQFSIYAVLFNTIVIYILGSYILSLFLIKSRTLLANELTDSYRFKDSDYKMCVKLCLSLGLMFGVILTTWEIFYNLESAYNGIASNNSSFFLISQFLFLTTAYGKSMFAIEASIPITLYVFYCIVTLVLRIRELTKYFTQTVSIFCQSNFPYVKIKTNIGDFEGKLKDIQNKNLVILYRNNILKLVPWDRIEKIEVCHMDIKESTYYYND